MRWADMRAFLGQRRGILAVQPLSSGTHDTGLARAERYGLSTYDAMTVASALNAGCDTLWSGDMQHAMTLAGTLRTIDRFRAAA
jgi:predicted nucleic acid-binding protein